jgi:hypothetical protein
VVPRDPLGKLEPAGGFVKAPQQTTNFPQHPLSHDLRARTVGRLSGNL